VEEGPAISRPRHACRKVDRTKKRGKLKALTSLRSNFDENRPEKGAGWSKGGKTPDDQTEATPEWGKGLLRGRELDSEGMRTPAEKRADAGRMRGLRRNLRRGNRKRKEETDRASTR